MGQDSIKAKSYNNPVFQIKYQLNTFTKRRHPFIVTEIQIRDLYHRHSFAVFRRCRHLLKNDEEARDTMQEVFLKFIENPENFQGRSSMGTYFYAMATHLCFNRMRLRNIRGVDWQNDLINEIEMEMHRENTQADNEIENKQVIAALFSEEDEETMAIAMYHFVDGLRQGEIGTLMGLSRVSINQKLQRFRERARERVEELS